MRKGLDVFEARLLEKSKRAKRREAEAAHERANGSRPKNAYKRHGRDHSRRTWVKSPDPGRVIEEWARSLPTSARHLLWEDIPEDVTEALASFTKQQSQENMLHVARFSIAFFGELDG